MENYLSKVIDLLQNPESFFNVLVIVLLSVIAYFLRSILQDFKRVKDEVADVVGKIGIDNERLNKHDVEIERVWNELKSLNERIIELLRK